MASFLVSNSLSSTERRVQPITFIEDDVVGVYYPCCNALIVRAIVARNGLKRLLVDNGSLANIIFGATFDKMDVDHELTLMTSPLYGFIGDSIIPRGKIL